MEILLLCCIAILLVGYGEVCALSDARDVELADIEARLHTVEKAVSQLQKHVIRILEQRSHYTGAGIYRLYRN